MTHKYDYIIYMKRYNFISLPKTVIRTGLCYYIIDEMGK